MTTTFSIQPVSLDDAEAVAELSGQLGYPTTPDAVRERIAKLPSLEKTQAVFVARLGEEVIGWIDVALPFHLQSPAHGLVGGLVVKDGVRGVGVGKRLCEAAENWVRAQGVQAIRVTSRSTRVDAHRFYLRDGYAAVKTSRVFEKAL